MHAGLASHMRKVQASRGQQCTSAARSCSLQAVAAASSRCRKHPNADPLANARLASLGGLPGASLHGQLHLVEQLESRSSSLSATLFRAAAKAFAQLCTSCLPACLLHAAEAKLANLVIAGLINSVLLRSTSAQYLEETHGRISMCAQYLT